MPTIYQTEALSSGSESEEEALTPRAHGENVGIWECPASGRQELHEVVDGFEAKTMWGHLRWSLRAYWNRDTLQKDLVSVQYLITRLDAKLKNHETRLVEQTGANLGSILHELVLFNEELSLHHEPLPQKIIGCFGYAVTKCWEQRLGGETINIEGKRFCIPTSDKHWQLLPEFVEHLRELLRQRPTTLKYTKKNCKTQITASYLEDLTRDLHYHGVGEHHKLNLAGSVQEKHSELIKLLSVSKEDKDYPLWWNSILCKMIQISLTRLAEEHKYLELREVLRNISKMKDEFVLERELDSEPFPWTKLVSVLFAEHLQRREFQNVEKLLSMDAFVMLLASWPNVLPVFLMHLSRLDGIIRVHIQEAQRWNLRVLGGVLVLVQTVMHALGKSFFADAMEHRASNYFQWLVDRNETLVS